MKMQRSVYQSIPLVAAIVSSLLGLVVLIAWHIRATALIQVIPNTPPVRYNTALALLLSGGALYCLWRGYRRYAVGLGSLVLMIGGLTLAQYVWQVDLGIDQILMEDYITGHLTETHNALLYPLSGHIQQLFIRLDHPLPGRLSPNLALGFSWLGLAFVSLGLIRTHRISYAALRRWERWAIAIAATSAVGVMAIGLFTLLGYTARLGSAYSWRFLTGIALPTAIVLPLLGLSIVLIALQPWRQQQWPPWFSGSVAFGVVTLSVLLWQALTSWHINLYGQMPLAIAAKVERLLVPAVNLVLVSGLLLALLLLGVLHFYSRAHIQAQRLHRLNQTLAQTNSLLQATLESTADGIVVFDLQHQITHFNHCFTQMWDIPTGVSQAMVVGDGALGLQFLRNQVQDPIAFLQAFDQAMQLLAAPTFHVFTLKNGRIVECYARPQWIDDQVVGRVFSYRDVTESQRLADALFYEKELAQVTLHSIGDAVITTDIEGAVAYINPMAERLTGWSQTEAQGLCLERIFQIVHEETRQPAPNPVAIALQENRIVELARETVLLSRDGREFGIDDSAAPIHDRYGNTIGAVIVFHDVTYTRQLTRQVTWQARHDALTGLVNRREFEQQVEAAMALAQQQQQVHALCYLDLDQFKIVNDTCGHMAGDELLRQVTVLLQAQIRKTDLLARLGGDEFGILLHQCDLKQAMQVANTLREVVQDFRFPWQAQTFAIGVSIGLVAIDASSDNLAALLMAADSACYVAKNQGRNRVHIFRADDQELLRQKGEMQWVTKLSHALEDNRFRLYVQKIAPIASTVEAEHYEVLLRLQMETGQLVTPGAFMPAAERYGLMPKLDRWVISSLFQQWSQMQQLAAMTPVPGRSIYAINISGASMGTDDFVEFVQHQFARYRVPPRRICFEVTETAAIANLSKARQFIQRLRSFGCHFALDDFGTGMSSFAYLKHLPVDYLKIDGIFIKNIVNDPVDWAIVDAISRTGRVMGLKIVAEFVENAAILAELQGLGVDYAQGYYIGQPELLFPI